MAPQQPVYFDPQERQRDKQAARAEDYRQLASGRSAAEIRRENALLQPEQCQARIDWSSMRHLRF